MKKLLAISLLVMSAFIAFGSNQADTIKVYFRVGTSQFEPGERDNAKVIQSFVDELNATDKSVEIDSVLIIGYASPDGSERTNKRLTIQRCKSVADYLSQHVTFGPEKIKTYPAGVDWDELRRLVEASPGVPKRDRVLEIIDNTPVWVYNSAGKLVNSRKNKLMQLAGGVPYNWLARNVFPELRNVVAVAVYFKKPELETPVEIEPEEVVIAEENVIIEKTHETIEETDSATLAVNEETHATKLCGNDRFAIKNNILFDAALMPNLEFEWLINNYWSVAVEGGIAWWKNDSRHKYYQLVYVTPEVRYHIRPRAAWHGMYVGVFGGTGKYDLENGGNGYKGEGGMIGASFGYMWPIGKHLSLEAAIGAGYLSTRYKEYEPREGHYLYLRTKQLNYFGPLKLKFSIAWRFGAKCKPNLNQSAL